MPYQNRVNPFGDIVYVPARGTVMGNRGCLHDQGETILKPYETTRWIICRTDYKDQHRTPMPPGLWTSLFFLDEATALAAGHRPCFLCNRPKANAFRDHWLAANPTRILVEQQMGNDRLDWQLHRERITSAWMLNDCRKHVYLERIDALPNYTFVALDPQLEPHLVLGDTVLPWSFEGYGPPRERPAGTKVVVLTPPSTVRALANGYKPEPYQAPQPVEEAAA
jgi:hypothetical protein